MTLFEAKIETPVGQIRLLSSTKGVCVLTFAGEERILKWLSRYEAVADVAPGDPHHVAAAIAAWFNGDQTALGHIPLDLRCTEFQQLVYTQLRKIPFGRIRTYGEVSAALGQISASRAVGSANGQNPIALIIPCHRVIGADLELRGFAGGVGIKAALLEFESDAHQIDMFAPA